MESPTCIKCGSTKFVIEEEDSGIAPFKLGFLRCAFCKAIAGLEDFYYVGERLRFW